MELHDISTEALEKELACRKQNKEDIPEISVATLYYRSRDKKLRAFATSLRDPTEAIQEVLAYLHKEKEVFLKPILYVINGGKPFEIIPQEAA